MNSGLIAHRYAGAFLEFLEGKGRADAVYGQIRVILSAMGKLPKFRIAITDPKSVSLAKRKDLLAAAVAPQELCPEIASLLELMHQNGRSEFFRLALLDFLTMYRQSRNLVMVQLTSAKEDQRLVPIITKLVEEDFGKKAVINQKIDPSIIGGFVFESWGYRLDASVRRQLEELRNQLKEENRRLV